MRSACRDRSRNATTLGYGPRFLHSTGQLHKGGANTGVFLQLTADTKDDLPVPGESYSFATLRDAQALGDLQVLKRRGRRVLRVHLGADIDAGLEALADAIAGETVAARARRPERPRLRPSHGLPSPRPSPKGRGRKIGSCPLSLRERVRVRGRR